MIPKFITLSDQIIHIYTPDSLDIGLYTIYLIAKASAITGEVVSQAMFGLFMYTKESLALTRAPPYFRTPPLSIIVIQSGQITSINLPTVGINMKVAVGIEFDF